MSIEEQRENEKQKHKIKLRYRNSMYLLRSKLTQAQKKGDIEKIYEIRQKMNKLRNSYLEGTK